MSGSVVRTLDDLHGGTFGFTLPMSWEQWLVFLVGAGLLVGGFVIMIPGLSAVGVLIMGLMVPTQLQHTLHNLRSQLRPVEVAWQKSAGGTELQSFWNDATVHRQTVDERSWVFPAPLPDDWHLEDRYAADEGGKLLDEHPNSIGTPRPPAVSNYGLACVVAFSLLVWQIEIIIGTSNGDLSILRYVLIGLCAVWLIISFFMWRRIQAMQDIPTSNIRSVAVGSSEIVGQVRPGPMVLPQTIVDNDRSKAVEDLVAWEWTYEIYVCRTESYTDSQGNVRTRQKCEWREIRADFGGTPFTLHDGTGGMAVLPNSFGSKEFGAHLIQWECRNDMRISRLLNNLFTSGDVRRHRWTLWGLKIGDPCYMLAMIQNRSDDVLSAENIDRTLQNALLEAIGEKSVGFKPRLEKGTELTSLAGSRSQVEYLIIPVLALLASIIMLGI